jgi:hypothetical protein
VRVTVIAAGFDRWDDPSPRRVSRPAAPASGDGSDDDGDVPIADVFAGSDDDGDDLDPDDDFDVPSFLQ